MPSTFQNAVSPEFDPQTETYQMHLDTEGACSAATELALNVSSVTGDDPTEMLPLHSAVDPDALEHHVGGRDRDAELSFDFHGYRVTVTGDGTATFAPHERDETLDGR